MWSSGRRPVRLPTRAWARRVVVTPRASRQEGSSANSAAGPSPAAHENRRAGPLRKPQAARFPTGRAAMHVRAPLGQEARGCAGDLSGSRPAEQPIKPPRTIVTTASRDRTRLRQPWTRSSTPHRPKRGVAAHVDLTRAAASAVGCDRLLEGVPALHPIWAPRLPAGWGSAPGSFPLCSGSCDSPR